ncbi:MAG: hypothetical protein ACRCV0_02790, partial [Brevinema sp.]
MINDKITIADYLGVTNEALDLQGVFNSLALSDEKVFLDPFLLKEHPINEFNGGLEKLVSYFVHVISIIITKLKYKVNSKEYLTYKREAEKQLLFKELQGIHIGYSSKRTSGAGIGKNKAESIELALTELIERGIQDPKIAYFLPVISDINIGADNISDMVIFILQDEIYQYTQRILKELNINKELKRFKCELSGKIYELLPDNINSKTPLLLLPKDLLSNLPLMNDFQSYLSCKSTNEDASKFV